MQWDSDLFLESTRKVNTAGYLNRRMCRKHLSNRNTSFLEEKKAAVADPVNWIEYNRADFRNARDVDIATDVLYMEVMSSKSFDIAIPPKYIGFDFEANAGRIQMLSCFVSLNLQSFYVFIGLHLVYFFPSL